MYIDFLAFFKEVQLVLFFKIIIFNYKETKT